MGRNQGNKIRGLSGLRSFIYLFKKHLLGSGGPGRNGKIGNECNVSGGTALVTPTGRHRSL